MTYHVTFSVHTEHPPLVQLSLLVGWPFYGTSELCHQFQNAGHQPVLGFEIATSIKMISFLVRDVNMMTRIILNLFALFI